MNKKPIIAIAVIAVLIAGFAGVYGIINAKKAGEEAGYIEEGYTDDSIPEEGYEGEMGQYADYGALNLYTGVVEAQKSLEIQKDSSRTVSDIYVEVGDEVAEGDPLFSYKTDDVSLKIEQANIELEGINNNIIQSYTQIDFINKQLAKLDEKKEEDKEQIADYQMQLLEIMSSIKQSEMSAKTKQAEINSLQKSVTNATVTSSINGVVKSINNGTDTSAPFMSIMGTGNFQIKCKVDEMNIYSLQEGMAVTIRSRVDDTTWKGTITKIETGELAKDENGGDYGYNSDEGTTSESTSKYYFYVTPENEGSLLLGQHVYVEAGGGEYIFEEPDGDLTPEEGALEDAPEGEGASAGDTEEIP